MVAGGHPPVEQGVVEGQGDRGRRGVAVAVDDHRRALLGDAQALAGGLDDPQVGLVGHEEVDVGGGQAGVGHRPLGRLDHHPHRLAEDLLAVHVQVAAVVALEQVAEGAVGAEVPAEQVPGPVDRLEHHRPGPVAHQHGHGAVVPVGDAAEGVGADEQDPARCRRR